MYRFILVTVDNTRATPALHHNDQCYPLKASFRYDATLEEVKAARNQDDIVAFEFVRIPVMSTEAPHLVEIPYEQISREICQNTSPSINSILSDLPSALAYQMCMSTMCCSTEAFLQTCEPVLQSQTNKEIALLASDLLSVEYTSKQYIRRIWLFMASTANHAHTCDSCVLDGQYITDIGRTLMLGLFYTNHFITINAFDTIFQSFLNVYTHDHIRNPQEAETFNQLLRTNYAQLMTKSSKYKHNPSSKMLYNTSLPLMFGQSPYRTT